MSEHECYMKGKIEEIQNDVKEIKKALLGDEYRKEGVIHDVKRHEAYIKDDQKTKWLIYGGVILIMFLLEFGNTIVELIKK